MWSALAEGFSEFASVVSKDAKTIYTKTSTVLQEKEDEDDAAEYEADREYQDDSPSSSPTSSFLTRISQDEFSKDIPTNPANSFSERENTSDIVDEENWISQVRSLQQSLNETFYADLDDEDANLFTPNWLRVDVSSINEEGMPSDTTERQLFSTGQLLLQNSETVRESFVTIFPEAKEGHSLETLQNAILEGNEAIADEEGKNNQRLLPSRFLVRYFVRLNKLFFHQVRGVAGRFETVKRQQQQNANNNNNEITSSSNLNKNLITRNQQLEEENENLQNRLRDQEQQIQDQTGLMTEYKVRWSDLIQEVDRLKAENSAQEKITRQLRLEVERLKFSAASSENSQKVNNNTDKKISNNSSSAVDVIPSQNSSQDGSSSKNNNENNSGITAPVDSASTKKKDQDDDDEEGWTDIA